MEALSHHSSNPLEARTSDSLNGRYRRTYEEAQRDQDSAFQSSDELGRWDDQAPYHNHIKEVFGISRFPSKLRGANHATPKAGPSRGVGVFRSAEKFVDLDEDMESEDELSRPFTEEAPVTPIARKLFKVERLEEMPHDEEQQDAVQELLPDEDEDTPAVRDEDMDEGGDTSRPDSRLSSLSPLTPLPASPNEYLTLTTRPEDEQEEILQEIQELYKSVPDLTPSYELIDRLGTGTFSSVYKAVDLKYDEWDNQPWLGHHPPDSTAYYQSAGPGYKGRGGRAARWRHAKSAVDGERGDMDEEMDTPGRVYVAIKRIYTTSGPERIRNELSIMEECRSCRHTSQITTAFRNNDQVVIDFYQSLHPEGIKCYFRCLFRALRDIHARGIIHRDVKPATFCMTRLRALGPCVILGLHRCRMDSNGPQQGRCLHTPANPKEPHGKNCQLNEHQTMSVKRAQREARTKSNMPADKVGYPEHDRRPPSKANRAGTRGFRAPEVLLKCGAQTGAIDVWSTGVILLFFLTGKFPIFQSNDDVEGLMEIAVIIGKKKIERAATLHGRTIATNIPDLDQDGITWQEVDDASPHPPSSSTSVPDSKDMAVQDNNQQSDRHANPPSIERHTKDMRTAFHFLESVLHFESTKRYTPRKALYHQFLEEPGMGGDDEYVPHLPGEGVCSGHHFKDDRGLNYHVLGGSEEDFDEDGVDDDGGSECGELVEDIGVAIGNNPCEFHRDRELYC
ncbi:kinase-like domain-containing protein [Flammula alnicola]|nr:kinase-like domain-containing protein [Flammula alnicola]